MINQNSVFVACNRENVVARIFLAKKSKNRERFPFSCICTGCKKTARKKSKIVRLGERIQKVEEKISHERGEFPVGEITEASNESSNHIKTEEINE